MKCTFPLNFKLNHFQSSCLTPKHHGGFLFIEFPACFAKQLCTIALGSNSNIQRWLLSGHPTTVTNKFTKAWRNFSAPESVAKDSSQLSLPNNAAAARPRTLLQSWKMINTTYLIEVGILLLIGTAYFIQQKYSKTFVIIWYFLVWNDLHSRNIQSEQVRHCSSLLGKKALTCKNPHPGLEQIGVM